MVVQRKARTLLWLAVIVASTLSIRSDAQAPSDPRPGPALRPVNTLINIQAAPNGTVAKEDLRVSVVGLSVEDVRLQSAAGLPLGLGIVMDSSGSTYGSKLHRPTASEVLRFLARVLRPGWDQAFWVNFSDDIFLDQRLTSDLGLLKEAATKMEARGGSKLFDSLTSSCQYVRKSKLPRRVLIVVSDGDDNRSFDDKTEAIKKLMQCDSVVYAINTKNPEKKPSSDDSLRRFSEATGGLSFRPTNEHEIRTALDDIEHDLRNQYVLSFVPSSRDGKEHLLIVGSADSTLAIRAPQGVYLPKKE